MSSIFDYSVRTRIKMLRRLGLTSCSVCGWDRATCDIHHVVPVAQGGSDENDNLTMLCPNCHREAHAGLLTKFVTLAEQLPPNWQDAYGQHRNQHRETTVGISPDARRALGENLVKARRAKAAAAADRVAARIGAIRASAMDLTVYGWQTKMAEVIDLPSQKVLGFMRKHVPEMLVGARLRRRP